jgi:SAM-dependent methyltransferase
MAMNYRDAWETFWETVSDDPQDVLWNASHEQAVAIDWQHLKEFMVEDDEPPLVDVGCGDGTQTTFFSGRVKRTIGVDVSQAAIDIANKSINAAEGVACQVLDLLKDTACRDFHESTGDAHVHMRGVLMQFLPADRAAAANNLQTILGARGCLHLHEHVPQTKACHGAIFQKQGMPMGFQRVLDSGIAPGGIARDEMERLFSGCAISKESADHTMTTIIALEGGGEGNVRVKTFESLDRGLADWDCNLDHHFACCLHFGL